MLCPCDFKLTVQFGINEEESVVTTANIEYTKQ